MHFHFIWNVICIKSLVTAQKQVSSVFTFQNEKKLFLEHKSINSRNGRLKKLLSSKLMIVKSSCISGYDLHNQKLMRCSRLFQISQVKVSTKFCGTQHSEKTSMNNFLLLQATLIWILWKPPRNSFDPFPPHTRTLARLLLVLHLAKSSFIISWWSLC